MSARHIDGRRATARPRRRSGRGDRGSTAVELAVCFPILIGLVLLFGQAFVWGVGWLAAQAAADHAAQTARVVDGSEAAGHADAHDLLAQLGGRFLDDPTVHVQRGPRTTTVTITGTAHGLPLPITVTVHAPTESVVPR